jgi:hypothetical protein
VGHEIPTALLPSLLTATLGAPAAALGLIEGIADGLAGAARLAGGASPTTPSAAALGRSVATPPPPSFPKFLVEPVAQRSIACASARPGATASANADSFT